MSAHRAAAIASIPLPARRAALPVLRIVTALGVVALVRMADGTQATDEALQVMGFDPDRARLIVALILAALAATTVSLLGGGRPAASLTGLGVAMAWFGGTFLDETSRALQPSGTTGRFDAGGWLLSLVALLVAGLAIAWAAAVLAREARDAILDAVAVVDPRRHLGGRQDRGAVDAGAAARSARGWRRAAPAIRVALVAAVAVLTLPALGDIFNYDPDVHMRSGGPAPSGLVGDPGPAIPSSGSPSDSPGASGPPATGQTSMFPADLVPGPVANSLVSAGALAGRAAWGPAPTGQGSIMTAYLPAPWTGGTGQQAGLQIYLPPGYASGTARYPVFYEAPSGLQTWDQGMAFTATMDNLITSGRLPPMIIVFASTSGGPYVDAECADTADGTEWFNRYMATDVVGWVDSHLRTIATPAARSTIGFSQGAYCSAAIMARHPDVFRTSISMSGYFQAGVRSGTTPIAWRPFNNDPAAMAAASPLDLVPNLPAQVRAGLMVIMEAAPRNPFYGHQAAQYSSALDAAGVPVVVLPDPLGHSWDAARTDIPAMLRLASLRMVQLGVFGQTS